MGLMYVYYMRARDIADVFYPSFAIRIFRFPYLLTDGGIHIASHTPVLVGTIVLYDRLMSVHSLRPYNARINEFLRFFILCPSSDCFSAQNSEMRQQSWEL
jgi:hypothetical protein